MGGEMTTVCCICNKTKKENSWEMMPIPYDRLVSHGYCPGCFDVVNKEIFNRVFLKPMNNKEIFR